jgi:SAM-dependent methyltransferase
MQAPNAAVLVRSVPAVDAYERVASEYDGAEHRTTRILENLSRRAVQFAQQSHNRPVRTILEIGAGTGALTDALLGAWPEARVIATDPSQEMLAVLERKHGSADGRLATAPAEVSSAIAASDAPPDLVAAGLADPFLDPSNLRDVRAGMARGSQLLLTVPSRSWARRERTWRLGIPLGTTRFRLRDGSVVFAKSLTYDEPDMRRLARAAGFVAIAVGTERSTEVWSAPEVCWALVTAP